MPLVVILSLGADGKVPVQSPGTDYLLDHVGSVAGALNHRTGLLIEMVGYGLELNCQSESSDCFGLRVLYVWKRPMAGAAVIEFIATSLTFNR